MQCYDKKKSIIRTYNSFVAINKCTCEFRKSLGKFLALFFLSKLLY